MVNVAGGGEGFFRLGADAEVGVGFGIDDLPISRDDVGCRQGQAPAFVAVDEGDVDEDGEVVVAVILGDGVNEAEFLCDRVAGIR